MLQSISLDQTCILKIQPKGLGTSWYTTGVDVRGRHLSGLLLFKEMPDSSTRVVFTNEGGVTFFDFEFRPSGVFRVRHVVSQLNKNPVITTLQKDFELMLGIPFKTGSLQAWRMSNEIRYGVHQKKETAYFITGPDCASLQWIELGSKRKKKTSVFLYGEQLQTPDSIQVSHHTFNMQINLKKLTKD